MTKPLALAVRKELLVARASLERAELVRALDRFGQAREPFERIARFASGLGGGAAPTGATRVADRNTARVRAVVNDIGCIGVLRDGL